MPVVLVVAIYAQGKRIASHVRSLRQGGHSTCTEHMPHAHRSMSEWSPERLLNWAGDIGSATRTVVERLLNQKRHKEQNYRSILALLSLAKKYDRTRLNKACERALLINSPTRTSIESILKKGLDHLSIETKTMHEQDDLFIDDHENVRGENYYH